VQPEASVNNLVKEAQGGSNDAIGQLVQLWYPRIYNYAYKYFSDSDMAAEATQNTFIAMHKHIGSLKECAKLKSWLYTIISNQCRQESRNRKKTRWLSFDTILPKKENSESPAWEISKPAYLNPESSFLQSELKASIKKCLQQLSVEQREVLLMKEYEGLKFREIAEILKVSENTVKSRLYYAFTHMRKLLEQENITQKNIRYED
jgi:RNA polymerase sigma-70 factor (ECF subfamily)